MSSVLDDCFDEIVGDLRVYPGEADNFSQREERMIYTGIENYSEKKCCPYCGAEMVVRQGYSTFYGCIKYPACRGIRQP